MLTKGARRERRAPPGGVRPKSPGRYHHGDLRQALLDAALVLVEREGRQALTLRAAARLAGVSSAAPYRHFDDKDALLAAVAEDGIRALTACMAEAAARHEGDPGRRFQALGVAYVTFAVAHTARFRVMFTAVSAAEGAHPSLSLASEALFALLRDAIVACQCAGVVRLGDPRELALSAWSMVHGLAELEASGQVPRLGLEPLGTKRLAEMVTHALFVGLARVG